MLRISATGEYALLFVRYLLDHPGSHRIADVASALGAPEPLLRKVSNALERAGLVASRRGRGGGVSLRNPAPTFYDVLSAAGENLRVTVCAHDATGCGRAETCAIAPTIDRLQRGLDAMLKISRI